MPDVLTPSQRHRVMASIHSASTKPELQLRHALWHQGFRYRINEKSLPGRPDIVMPKYRTVVFVNGCFWHGHKGCPTSHIPETNTEFWMTKLERNQKRDQEVWRQLEAKGWSVIIVWECQLKKDKFEDTILSVITEIRNNGELHDAVREQRRAAREAYRLEMKAKRELENKIISGIKSR